MLLPTKRHVNQQEKNLNHNQKRRYVVVRYCCDLSLSLSLYYAHCHYYHISKRVLVASEVCRSYINPMTEGLDVGRKSHQLGSHMVTSCHTNSMADLLSPCGRPPGSTPDVAAAVGSTEAKGRDAFRCSSQGSKGGGPQMGEFNELTTGGSSRLSIKPLHMPVRNLRSLEEDLATKAEE